MISPRLLSVDEARVYLGGCDPTHVVEPLRFGRRIVWDRFALDRALNRMSGFAVQEPANLDDDPEAALAEWKSRESPAARRS